MGVNEECKTMVLTEEKVINERLDSFASLKCPHLAFFKLVSLINVFNIQSICFIFSGLLHFSEA